MGLPPQAKTRISIFASGNGTNAESCMRYFSEHPAIAVALIVTNNPQAGVIQRAAKFSVAVHVLDKAELHDPQKIVGLMQVNRIQWIVLAGYLKLIPAALIDLYPRRIVNIHPALLPKYGGKGMYGHKVHAAVFANGEKKSGITIHIVDAHYDTGDILFQKSFAITDSDTPETIEKKVRRLELKYLPKVVETLILPSG